MKRILSLILLPLLAFFSGKAQTDNKSLLWKINGNGLTKPSYLFGTMHLICADDYIWTEAMKKSLSSCREVCFELDMDEPGMQEEAMSGLIATDGKALKERFKPEDYIKLEAFTKAQLGMDLSFFQQMKPIALQTLFELKVVSCASPVSYEMNIMEEAQKQKMAVVGLEEVSEQTAALSALPDDSIINSLVEMVDSFEHTRVEYGKMLKAYKAQDLPKLYEQVTESEELGAANGMDALLDDRNKKWIPRMTIKMKKQPVFFAVGAGHLWGDVGVIELLRKAGYAVTSVK